MKLILLAFCVSSILAYPLDQSTEDNIEVVTYPNFIGGNDLSADLIVNEDAIKNNADSENIHPNDDAELFKGVPFDNSDKIAKENLKNIDEDTLSDTIKQINLASEKPDEEISKNPLDIKNNEDLVNTEIKNDGESLSDVLFSNPDEYAKENTYDNFMKDLNLASEKPDEGIPNSPDLMNNAGFANTGIETFNDFVPSNNPGDDGENKLENFGENASTDSIRDPNLELEILDEDVSKNHQKEIVDDLHLNDNLEIENDKQGKPQDDASENFNKPLPENLSDDMIPSDSLPKPEPITPNRENMYSDDYIFEITTNKIDFGDELEIDGDGEVYDYNPQGISMQNFDNSNKDDGVQDILLTLQPYPSEEQIPQSSNKTIGNGAVNIHSIIKFRIYNKPQISKVYGTPSPFREMINPLLLLLFPKLREAEYRSFSF